MSDMSEESEQGGIVSTEGRPSTEDAPCNLKEADSSAGSPGIEYSSWEAQGTSPAQSSLSHSMMLEDFEQDLFDFEIKDLPKDSDLKSLDLRSLSVKSQGTRDNGSASAIQHSEAIDWPIMKQKLEKELEELKSDNDALKAQASAYREDFAKEREDRTNLAGRLNTERDKYKSIIDNLSSELLKQNGNNTPDRERHTRPSRISNFGKRKDEDLQKKFHDQTVRISQLEVSKIEIEGRLQDALEKLQATQRPFSSESRSLAEFDRSTSLATAEEEIMDLKSKLRMKERYLQVAESEKQGLQEELKQSHDRLSAVSQDLETARRELEISNACLSEKTALVKQHSSQAASFESQLKDLVGKLGRVEKECQELKKTMEENVNSQAEGSRKLREKMRLDCEEKVNKMSAHFETERNHFEGILNRKLQEANDENERIRQEYQQLSAEKADIIQQLYDAKLEAVAAQDEALAKASLASTTRINTELSSLEEEWSSEKESMLEKLNDLCRVKESLLSVTKQLNKILKAHDEIMKEADTTSPKEVSEESLKCFEVKPKTKLKFTDPLGVGAYGAVFIVNLNGTVCIAKRLQDILLGRGSREKVGVADKEALHAKFCRECFLMSQTKHPNIVKFLGVHFGRDRFDLTLFMEKLESDLEVYINNNQVDLKAKLSILHDVSCGLLYLHEECSIIHRDLTAGNVLLTSDQTAKIADLGVSRLYHRRLAELSKIPGTLYYMPPEALKDNPSYDKSIDIFSLGVLALYLANQTSPDLSWENIPDSVVGRGEGELYKRRRWIELMEQKQPQLASLVSWCLADNPQSRPSTYCVNIWLQELKVNFS